MHSTSNRKPRTTVSPEGLLIQAIVFAILVRIGMVLLFPIGATLMFFLPVPGSMQHALSGLMVAVLMAAPLMLVLILGAWAWQQPRQPGRNYRGIPIGAAALGFLITVVPLPFDRSPSLASSLEKSVGGIRAPRWFRTLPERIEGFFDACQRNSDCEQAPEGFRHVCAADAEGVRMCVEVTEGGCCPTKTGCQGDWVCVALKDPSRERPAPMESTFERCVPPEIAPRFPAGREAHSCARPPDWRQNDD
ncbi:hypothetical protein POL68_28495 [Stigmatella sp. ncwal1]|uniref:Uncharacterized protein n=1 Tax=Stigmatella ashevillensis TaxID=2995309 RepID=A0ABT5DFI9_9BACT|nr:hypothetical protein [Stigmatella ashevillena]MDC0712435.1 hypothetical protein [Stigmatella ashevillena]